MLKNENSQLQPKCLNAREWWTNNYTTRSMHSHINYSSDPFTNCKSIGKQHLLKLSYQRLHNQYSKISPNFLIFSDSVLEVNNCIIQPEFWKEMNDLHTEGAWNSVVSRSNGGFDIKSEASTTFFEISRGCVWIPIREQRRTRLLLPLLLIFAATPAHRKPSLCHFLLFPYQLGFKLFKRSKHWKTRTPAIGDFRGR